MVSGQGEIKTSPTPDPEPQPGEKFADFWQQHPEILKSYLWYQSSLALVLLDPDKIIVDGNWGFARLLGETVTWLQQPLHTLLSADSLPTLAAFPDQGGERQLRLTFQAPTAGTITFTCHVRHLGQGYVLFGEKPLPSQNEVIEELSRLTNELTNISRTLAQKNRELAQANAAITQLTRTDPLTGLANRRFLMETLTTAISLAQRHNTPLSVVLADLDYFKGINDTYGHDVGDAVLQHFAQLLQETTRVEDLVARWGGEEFVIVLPHTTTTGAGHLANRLRQKLATAHIPGLDRQVTASFGISQLRPGEDAQILFKRADQALYQAKADGRNRVATL